MNEHSVAQEGCEAAREVSSKKCFVYGEPQYGWIKGECCVAELYNR